MREKRSYKRINLDLKVLVYIGDYDEIVGEITNISEDSIGLRIELTQEQRMMLEALGMLKFQFIDSYRDGSKEKTDVVQACGLVKRLEITGSSCLTGCMVRDEGFRRYVLRRVLSQYFK